MVKFVDGFNVKEPGKAPDFVKCRISVDRKKLGNWLRNESDDWINIDIKVSKKGNWYAEVNEWKPDKSKEVQQAKQAAQKQKPTYDDFDDDIQF